MSLPIHARLFIRRMGEVEGVKRCVVGGTILSVPLAGEESELWDGQIILMPTRRLIIPERYDQGKHISEVVTSYWFAAPHKHDLKEVGE